MNRKPKFHLTLGGIRKAAFFAAALVIAANIGYRLGTRDIKVSFSPGRQIVVNTSPPPSREIDFSLFWDVWGRLEKNYVDKSKIEPGKMVQGAISGMVASLDDPYTVFLPPKDNAEYKADLNGTFEGIGAQLGTKEDKIVVVAPLKGEPAEKAGILAGDWITKVDGVETAGWTVPQAVSKIRGPKSTKVKLTIIREGAAKPLEFTITRQAITLKSVEFSVKQANGCTGNNCPSVAYIKLSRFGDSTNDEWNTAVSDIKARINKTPPLTGIVLDLRNNPGGYLQSAIYVAAEFLPSGIIVQQENSDGTRETYSVNRVGNLLNQKLVVLVNKGSASAAEIVAGALHDHKRGTLIGETTFGKGSIQTPEDLPDGSGLHITTARWILPNGDWIDKKGITPDIVLTDSGEASASAVPQTPVPSVPANPADPQFDRAIIELAK